MKTPKEWAAECLSRIPQQPSYGKQPSEIIEAILTEALAERDAEIARLQSLLDLS